MASSSSQALAKRSSDSALMPPPRVAKRQKRPAKLLDEDVYSDALSTIIARDFFPGLLETDVQAEYLDALESQNSDWIREAGRNLTQVMTPRPGARHGSGRGLSFIPRGTSTFPQTPQGSVGQTPGRTPTTGDFAPEKREEVDLNLSLGAFQSKYTSEDNESFNELLDKQNQRRAEKYSFFQDGNKIPSARQLAHRAREQKLLAAGGSATTSLVTVNALGEERRMLAPTQPSENLDARPGSVESFRNTQGPRNHFMFDPDGVEDSMPTTVQVAEQKSNAPPKAVHYAATRFKLPETESTMPPSPSVSAIDAAIAGKPKPTASEPGYSGADTPRVNGYAFVDAEPTPDELGVPVTDEEADGTEREAAEQFLPKADESGPNPFNIATRSKREDLHLKLLEKADSRRRKGGRLDQLRNLGITPGRTPTPSFASGAQIKKTAAMTPAAQKLAERIGTPKRGAGMFEAAGKGNRSWTPTPRVKRPG